MHFRVEVVKRLLSRGELFEFLHDIGGGCYALVENHIFGRWRVF